MKVSILARKDKRDAAGSFPLFVRIAHRAVVRDVSLDLRVKKRDWNDRARKIRKSHPNHAKLNRYLTRVESDVHRIIADLLSTGDEVNPKEVQLRLKSSLDREQGTGADFLSYCDSLVEADMRHLIDTYSYPIWFSSGERRHAERGRQSEAATCLGAVARPS